MSMRLTQVPQDSTTGENTDPICYQTTYDGQTFNWAPGEKRAFADDGQAIGHANNINGENGNAEPDAGVIEDNALSLKYRPEYASRA